MHPGSQVDQTCYEISTYFLVMKTFGSFSSSLAFYTQSASTVISGLLLIHISLQVVLMNSTLQVILMNSSLQVVLMKRICKFFVCLLFSFRLVSKLF